MLKTRKSITLSGVSQVISEVKNEDSTMSNSTDVVTMSAYISEDRTINVSKNIINTDLYLKNKESCDKDMSDFETLAISLLEQF